MEQEKEIASSLLANMNDESTHKVLLFVWRRCENEMYLRIGLFLYWVANEEQAHNGNLLLKGFIYWIKTFSKRSLG